MKPLKSILFVICISVSAVLGLFLISDKPNQSNNGFLRHFLEKKIILDNNSFDLKSPNYYIAGCTKDSIYLGKYAMATQLSSLDRMLEKFTTLNLNIPVNEKTAWGAMKLTLDSPYIFAYEGLTPKIYIGSVKKNTFRKSPLNNTLFQHLTPVNNNSFVFRLFEPKLNQNILRKFPENHSFSLDKMNEGSFSTDGMLLYHKKSRQIIYVYYYRNQYVILDSLLIKKDIGHTIDTVANPTFKTDKVKSDNTITLLGNPTVVNKFAYAYENKLYIHSGLQADNEREFDFNNFIVFDVYNLSNTTYLYSFYVNKFKDLKLYDFRVIEGELYAIFENYLVRYILPREITEI